MTTSASAAVLADAAFGEDPGRWPLPAAATPDELWLRAVAAGGQGRYASARADLARLCRTQRDGPLTSLAHSTYASFLRQLGRHADARGWDGRASALADSDAEAAADALIGLAADALGLGRFAAAQRALHRAAERLSDAVSGRLPVRLAWVSAELAMARGEGVQAVRHAEQAVEAAATLGSARHAVKSDVVRAAALCSAGDLDAARRVADAALAETERLGMIPLRWALACLLADIGSATCSSGQMVAIRDESADTVRSRGGVWAVHVDKGTSS
ncbi:hypothetical protein H7I53_01695 [Mycolicibacterium pulveris]|uniref:Uncharacterized protein n=1 Tax=Mycolicibacterium pulveris TaxID=36813 RepID=A0A7I7UEV2_MYCPV|nr:hypothetical protein [Mycolicibacterium pulveris]MCV6978939.1 hypothetical protein [Mycolicibacterium pulveris]BBY79862.1 hypothetical protein MPUL_10200 [Mycolicibacterium pulveris]